MRWVDTNPKPTSPPPHCSNARRCFLPAVEQNIFLGELSFCPVGPPAWGQTPTGLKTGPGPWGLPDLCLATLLPLSPCWRASTHLLHSLHASSFSPRAWRHDKGPFLCRKPVLKPSHAQECSNQEKKHNRLISLTHFPIPKLPWNDSNFG